MWAHLADCPLGPAVPCLTRKMPLSLTQPAMGLGVPSTLVRMRLLERTKIDGVALWVDFPPQ